ncbi:Nn.00g034280.m01.CDS01 [Neocucurbitaria sp. VM-36]
MSAYRVSPLRQLEVWKDQANGFSIRKDDVSIEKLVSWQKKKAGELVSHTTDNEDDGPVERPTLQLLCCNFGALSTPVGYGTHAIGHICDAFALHWTTREALINNNGTFARHFTKDPQSGAMARMHLVVRVPHFVIGSYGLSLVFDNKTATTRALLYGYTDKDYQGLLEYLQDKSSISFFQNPLLLAGRLLQSYRRNAEVYRAKIDNCIFRTEIALGYAVPGSFMHVADVMSTGKLDFDRFVQKLHSCHDEFMQKLHSCQTELGALSHTGNFGRELGLFLRKTSEELDDASMGPRCSGDNAFAANEHILHDIDFQTNLWWTLLSQMAVLKERAQTHINLIFSFIAQDENRLSRSVAQKSEMIAAASKKDSAAMKTLAVLTTVFLPPTFVETFFSMTMFDWGSEASGTAVTSRYLWVYWAVAIPLTVLVLITWRVWWALEERNIQKELHKEK